MLREHAWKRKYTTEDGDLYKLFYVPALLSAKRYDRLSGYFSAGALSLAARGVEALVRNEGRMRLVTGCTLAPPEIEAILEGEQLREQVERHYASIPLKPPNPASADALELLAWMVARKFLDVRIAVPCDVNKVPIPNESIFHEKSGVIEDLERDRIAWNGSLNETGAGWKKNWESINVFTSWGIERDRVNDEATSFDMLWDDRSSRVVVLDLPESARRDLLSYMPKDGLPKLLRPDQPEIIEPPLPDRRSKVWAFIRKAPTLKRTGERVGESTAPVTPWPHQVRAFQRLHDRWPPKLLIADEVGLGKTIQAGLLLRQTWLAGKAKRILILAPKAVIQQWQIELREKFNLNWPIYDGTKLAWYESQALRGKNERKVGLRDWHREPIVIASSHLMRRKDRAAQLLEAKPWDLVVLDEAHHARRRGAGSAQEKGPNMLLRLMQQLKEKTKGLVLLTATPMQVHPAEVWDLLDLLGLPEEWTRKEFIDFFEEIAEPAPSTVAFDRMARLFQACERHFDEIELADAERCSGLSRLKVKRVLRALRDRADTPRRRLTEHECRAAINIMRASTPIRMLVSRHTRALLREYFKAGKLTTPIADREVMDRFIKMSSEERAIYEAVEEYIATTYNQASDKERNAVGFVMTIYRRRLASSFLALQNTLERHLEAITTKQAGSLKGLEEDAPDDESADEILDADDVAKLEAQALAAEEAADIKSLLARIKQLPVDSKLERLRSVLKELRQAGYQQAMVFTQYSDTMDFLRDALGKKSDLRLMCFSGRGGEVPSAEGSWNRIGRDDAKRRFREKQADVLLCTDAAAEGLNFQFCGALVNYDMPWNPMRVEQRIGRIDRLGQENPIIKIVNLHYDDTVETDVYVALKGRIGLFESVVGRLQPILASLPQEISKAVLTEKSGGREQVVKRIERQVGEAEEHGFDIDTVTEADLEMPDRPDSPITMTALSRVVGMPELMPPDTKVRTLQEGREYALEAPDMPEVRVTTDPAYFQENSDSLEFWSPGNPVFRAPDELPAVKLDPKVRSLDDLLDS